MCSAISFYNREAEVTPAKKDHGNRRKRKNSADQMMGMEYVQHVQHYTLRTVRTFSRFTLTVC